jgi:hypothetical protein
MERILQANKGIDCYEEFLSGMEHVISHSDVITRENSTFTIIECLPGNQAKIEQNAIFFIKLYSTKTNCYYFLESNIVFEANEHVAESAGQNSAIEIFSKQARKPIALVSKLTKADKKIQPDDCIQDEFFIACKTNSRANQKPKANSEKVLFLLAKKSYSNVLFV